MTGRNESVFTESFILENVEDFATCREIFQYCRDNDVFCNIKDGEILEKELEKSLEIERMYGNQKASGLKKISEHFKAVVRT